MASDSPTNPTERTELIICAGLCLAAFLAVLLTANQFGLTYDEPIYAGKSVLVAEWLQTLLHDPLYAISDNAIQHYWSSNDHHPAAVKLVAAVTTPLVGAVLPGLAAVRAATALLFAACLWAVYAWARRYFGRTEAVVGCLALMLMPRVFADAHLLSLDVPVMSAGIITLYCLLRLREQGTWRWAILTGLAFGWALNCKVNAFFLPAIALVWFAFTAGLGLPRSWPQALLAFALIGPLFFWLTWPWLWHETPVRLAEYLRFHFKHWAIDTYYFGRTWTYAPFHYPFVMTAITTPPLTLLAAMVGLWHTGRLWRRRDGGSPNCAQTRAALLIWIALAINYLFAALPTTPKYNGVRLFLPVFPLWALLAGIGFNALISRLLSRFPAARPRLRSQLHALAAALLLLPSFYATGITHPFELSYYNLLIGGVPGAARHGMEPTYWGDTYAAGWNIVARRAPPGATVWVAPPGCISLVQFYQHLGLRPDLMVLDGEQVAPEADFAIFQNKPNELNSGCRTLLQCGLPPVETVQLSGVPLHFVFGKDAIQRLQGSR